MRGICFRCDANESVGLGHFSRCYNIALGLVQQRHNLEVHFWGNLNEFSKGRIKHSGFSVSDRAPENLAQMVLFHDQYGIDQAELEEFRRIALALVKLDDFNELDSSKIDAVINFRIGAETTRYQCQKVFLGTQFYPNPPEIAEIRNQKSLHAPDEKVQRILLFLGGRDLYGFTSNMLKAIGNVIDGAEVLLVHPANLNTRDLVCGTNSLNCVVVSTKIADYYGRSDVIICGGGLTKYEAGFCAIPNACLSQTDGQDEDTRIAAEKNLTFDLGRVADHLDDNTVLEERLREFLELDQRNKIHLAGLQHFNSGSLANLSKGLLEVFG